MTIDDFIIHSREVAIKNRENADALINNPYIPMNIDAVEMANNCVEIAEEHEQLAELLEKLKTYEESLALKTEYYAGYDRGYAEAVDDFVNAVDKKQQEDWISNLEYGITFSDIEQIAEQLKVGGDNVRQENARSGKENI